MVRIVSGVLILTLIYEAESLDCNFGYKNLKCNNGCCWTHGNIYCCSAPAPANTTTFTPSGLAITLIITGGVFIVTGILLLMWTLYRYRLRLQVKPGIPRQPDEFHLNIISTGNHNLEALFGSPPLYSPRILNQQLPEIST